MKSIAIIGTGGSAYDMLDIVEAINAVELTWRMAGFVDDAKPVGSSHLGFPVLSRIDDIAQLTDIEFINVIGSDRSFRLRPHIIVRTVLKSDRFATLVHPMACVSSRARLGRGVGVNYGVSVGGGVVIGDHVQLGPGCIIGHDSVIEDYAVIAPGVVVSGFVRIGRNAYIGAGAMIRQQQQIGEQALVGLGAVVVSDVAAGDTVVGNPARVLTHTRQPLTMIASR